MTEPVPSARKLYSRRPLRSTADFATLLHRVQPREGWEVYRIFKVYHPALEAETNITVQEVSESYHIIEKFMDILVCNHEQTVGGAPRIRDKDELLRLLGIDYEAYEIASLYFDDLVKCGHFRVEPDGIYPCQCAIDSVASIDMHALFASDTGSVEELEDLFGAEEETKQSVKLDRKYTQRRIYSKKLFDQYTKQLMPACFYGVDGFISTPEAADGNASEANALWLPPVSTILDAAVDLEMGILTANRQGGKTHYENGLPQGFAGMTIVSGTQPQLRYCPYYLVVYLDETENLQFAAHDILSGEEIPWLSECYGQPPEDGYASAKQLVCELCALTESDTVQSPIVANWPIVLDGKTAQIFGYSDGDNGNFRWTMQPWQLPTLEEMCKYETKRKQVWFALNNTFEVMNNFLAGRTVEIRICEEYRQRLRQELEKPCQDEKTPALEEKMDEARKLFIQGKGIKELTALKDACPEAAFWLGYIRERAGDYGQALGHYLQAAEGGYVPAMVCVAGMMAKADPLPENTRTAKEWLQLAEEKGFDCSVCVLPEPQPQPQAAPAPAEGVQALWEPPLGGPIGKERSITYPADPDDPKPLVEVDYSGNYAESALPAVKIYGRIEHLMGSPLGLFCLPEEFEKTFDPFLDYLYSGNRGDTYESLANEAAAYPADSVWPQDLEAEDALVAACPSPLQMIREHEDAFSRCVKNYREDLYDPAKGRYTEDRALVEACYADPAYGKLLELLSRQADFANRNELLAQVQMLTEEAADRGNPLMQYLFYRTTVAFGALSCTKTGKKEKGLLALKQAADAGLSVAMVQYAQKLTDPREKLQYLDNAAQTTLCPAAFCEAAKLKHQLGMLSEEALLQQLALGRSAFCPQAFAETDDAKSYPPREYARELQQYHYAAHLLHCSISEKREMLVHLEERRLENPEEDPFFEALWSMDDEEAKILTDAVSHNLQWERAKVKRILTSLQKERFLPAFFLADKAYGDTEALAKGALLGGSKAAERLGRRLYKNEPEVALRCYRFAAARGNEAAADALWKHYLRHARSEAELQLAADICRSLMAGNERALLAYGLAFRFGTDLSVAKTLAVTKSTLFHRVLRL